MATFLTLPTWEGTATVMVLPTRLPDISLAQSGTTETSLLQTGMLVRNLGELAKDHNLQLDVIRSEKVQLAQYIQDRSKKPKERFKEFVKNVFMLRFILGKKKTNWEVKAKKELDGSWLNIVPSEGSSKLPLVVYGTDPEKTIAVGNAILDQIQIYMDKTLKLSIEGQLKILNGYIDDNGNNIVGLIETAQVDVASVERDMSEYRQTLGVISPQNYANQLQSSVHNLENQLNLTLAKQSGLQTSIASLDVQLATYQPYVDLVKSSETVKNNDLNVQKLDASLAQLRADRQSKLVTMKLNAPVILALDEQIKSLDASLAAARAAATKSEHSSEQVSKDWDPRYKQLFNTLIDFHAQVDQATAELGGIQNAITAMGEKQLKAIEADTVLKQMNRRLQMRLQRLENFSGKVSSFEAMLAQEHIFTGMQVLEKFHVNAEGQPDRPNRLIAVILAIAIAFFTALVLPVAYDYLNQTLLSSQQASSIPGIRLAAIVPKMRASQMTKNMSM